MARICNALSCDIGDIMEVLPNEQENGPENEDDSG